MAIVKLKIKSKLQAVIWEEENLAKSITLHGAKFIFDSNKQKFIRIFWIFAFTASLCGCIYQSRGNYEKLMIEPVAESVVIQKSRSEIPLPAITICTYVYAKSGLANYDEALTKIITDGNYSMPRENLKYLIANTHSFSPNMVFEICDLQNFNESFDVVDYLNKSQHTIDEIMFDCEIGGKNIQCTKIFKRVMVSNNEPTAGVCFTFNQENFRSIFNEEVSHDFDFYDRENSEDPQWTLDGGYETSNESAVPLRATEENCLMLSLKMSEEDAMNAYLLQTRFYINFKKPNQVTSTSRPYFLPFGKEKTFTFSAKVSSYTQEFRRFAPEKRGCYFTDERQLKYFKAYTEQNCLDECLINVTLKTCDCVKFSMPRDELTPVCALGNESYCYFLLEFNFPTKDDGNPPCGCFKTCNDIEYSITNEKEEILKAKVGRKIYK